MPFTKAYRAVLVLAPTGQTELSLALCASARSRARPSASQEGAPRPAFVQAGVAPSGPTAEAFVNGAVLAQRS